MCETCGCGESGEFKINGPHDHHHDHESNYDHERHHGHSHDHHQEHDHEHDHEHSHNHDHTHKKVINLNMDILSENTKLAQLNRRFFEGRKVLCLNLVSSPGSGKTTILEKTIKALIPTRKIAVIEGDQQTLLDADRIEKAGAPAIQINTGSGCHLDARMVELALQKLEIEFGSILFIENVGNLVCPALFDLGEMKRVVVISVTEGDDKPLKYLICSSHPIYVSSISRIYSLMLISILKKRSVMPDRSIQNWSLLCCRQKPVKGWKSGISGCQKEVTLQIYR